MRSLIVRRLVQTTHPLQRERLKQALRLLLKPQPSEVSHASGPVRPRIDSNPGESRYD